MNPQASAFVPKTRSPTSTSAVAASYGPPPAAAPVAAKVVGSKLRAGASEFVPKSMSSAVPPPPPPISGAPPNYATAVNAGTSRPPTPSTPTAAAAERATPIRDYKMSPDATPYTPTRMRGTPTSGGAPSFPSVPPPAPAGATAADPSAGTTAAKAASQPAAGAASAASVSSSDPPSPSSATRGAAAGPPARGAKYIAEHPFMNSKLQVPRCDRITTPPAEIPKLDCTWRFYADDHPTRSFVQIGSTTQSPTGDSAYNPVEIRIVTDIAEFWRLWRHVPSPSLLPVTSSFTYYWFRRDIKPSWEDERNKNGGTISINVFDRDIPSLMDKQAAEDAFLAALCLLTGESVKELQAINGLAFKLRKTGKWTLQLWTLNSSKAAHQAAMDELKKELLKLLPAEALTNIPFMPHSTTAPTSASASAAAAATKRPKGGKPIPPKTAFKPEPAHYLS